MWNSTEYFNKDSFKTGIEECEIQQYLQNKDEESLEILLENYYYVLYKQANDWLLKTKHHIHKEDLMQDCILSFCKSYWDYDCNSKLHFVSFFKMNIFGYLQQRCSTIYRTISIPKSAFSKIKHLSSEEKLNQFVRKTDVEEDIYLLQPDNGNVCQEEYLINEIDLKNILKKIKGIVKPIEYEYLCRRYGVDKYSPHTFEELGSVFNVSKQAASQRMSRILAKLKTILKEEI